MQAVTVVLLISCSSATAQVLSPQGYGMVSFGHRLADIERAVGERAQPQVRVESCDFVRFRRYPGISFMVEDGTVTRADAAGNVRNSASISVGAPLSVVARRYPAGRIEPHKYDEQGHYFILDTPNRKAALLFEESGGRITDIRAGVQPSVEYVEGCL
jgi:hypothetical protein